MVRDEYIFEAFRLCLRHKAGSPSAAKYFFGYEEDLLELCDEINGRTYYPTTSTAFVVTKPQYREVFAANFRDRIVHHYYAMRVEPLMEAIFSPRSFNCRKGKGVLYGIDMLRQDIYECSEGYTKDCWVAELDLQGFFMSIDKKLLCSMLDKFITENYDGDDKEDILWLNKVIVMHEPEKDCRIKGDPGLWKFLPKNKSLFTNGDGLGLPIGNLSSQLNANYLLHWLDMFLEKLGFQYHDRYVDDFRIVDQDKQKILNAIPKIRRFLSLYLHVKLHPNKFNIKHYKQGINFTGAIIKPGRTYAANRTVANFNTAVYRLNRAKSREEIEKAVMSINSYLGFLRHTNSYHIRRRELLKIAPEKWDWVYVKGRFVSVAVKKYPTKKPAPKSEWPKIYYMNSPIDYRLIQESS